MIRKSLFRPSSPPLATITASVFLRISSKLARPSWFSILEMIWMSAPSTTLLMLSMSEGFLTKDAAMKSMSLGMPQCTMSSTSFYVRVGKSTLTPGKLQFFLSPSVAVLVHLHFTLPPGTSQEMTLSTMLPSAINI